MRKFFALLAVLVMPMTLSAQTGLIGGPDFVGNSNFYKITYLESGGASYWHSMWAFDWNGSVATDSTLLFCKIAGCASNSFYGQQQPTQTFAFTSPWILGLYVETNGVADATPDGTGYWLYSIAGLNGNTSYLYNFGLTGVKQDDRTTFVPNSNVSVLDVYGWEDIRGGNGVAGGDRDFNDAIFTIEDSGTPTEVVPEPATMTLLATGLAGMIGAGMKRKRNK